jgi:hypothetical protein
MLPGLTRVPSQPKDGNSAASSGQLSAMSRRQAKYVSHELFDRIGKGEYEHFEGVQPALWVQDRLVG